MAEYYNVDPNSKEGNFLFTFFRWMLRIFTLVGLTFLIIAAVKLVKTVQERKTHVFTEGTIVEFDEKGSPIMEYAVDGQTYTFRSNYTDSSWRVGQSIRLKYPASDPAGACAADGDNVMILVFGIVGAAFTAIPLLILIFLKKAQDEASPEQFARQPRKTPNTDRSNEEDDLFLVIIRWMLRGFIILGVICLAVALIFLGKMIATRGDYVKTEGTIVEINASGYPTVEYAVNGQTYRFVSNATSSSLREGQSYKVQYPLVDPSAGRSVTGSYVLPIVFGALGVGFTVIPWVVKKFTVDLIEKLAEEKEEQPAKL